MTTPGSEVSGDPFDVLVVGAGFGGLGAALTLAERGARVCLCETLRYPGGCASTFQRGGLRFDAGATLLSGLEPSQPFGRWLSRYAPGTRIDWLDPLVELRAPALTLPIGRKRSALVAELCTLPGAPVSGIRAFFAQQERVASVLWALFEDPTLLPPFDLRMLARHATRFLDYAAIAPLLGRTLAHVLASHGIAEFAPLRLYVDALCQITVQCPAAEAEASFALAAMDYYYRGTGHVHGGVGVLAQALLDGCSQAGASVRLSTRVTGLARRGSEWLATTRRGHVRARTVIANVLPQSLGALVGDGASRAEAERLSERGDPLLEGWGAAMLYAVARPPLAAGSDARHLQLIDDETLPLAEGNHVFVSASSADETDRAPAGFRTLTMSTHVPLPRLIGAGPDAGTYIASVQARMRQTLAARAPEWSAGLDRVMTASPPTFARFVGRTSGAVGGLPRRAGLGNYRSMGPVEALRGLWLVGDSVFPGQSALATAVGGMRTAAAVARALGASTLGSLTNAGPSQAPLNGER
jgi:phytoene dehydrogenase-like protein